MYKMQLNLEVVRDFMVVFVTGKNKEDPMINEAIRVLTTFSLYKF